MSYGDRTSRDDGPATSTALCVTARADRDDLTKPGTFEVAPEVHRVPLPLPNDGLRAVNVYVVEGDDGPVLIDSGWAITEAPSLLDRSLQDLGHCLKDVSGFLTTHVHRDHYTQAVSLRRAFGMRVSLGIGEQPSLQIIQQPDRHPFSPQLHLLPLLDADTLADDIKASLGVIDSGERDDWESPDDWLEFEIVQVGPGRQLSVVPTPGHTQGPVVSSTTRQARSCSRVTPYCRRSPPRSASSRCCRRIRWVTSWGRWRVCAGFPTRCCCPRTARSLPACTRASTSSSPITTRGSRRRSRRRPAAPRRASRSRAASAGPDGTTGSASWTRSIRCWRWKRRPPTSTSLIAQARVSMTTQGVLRRYTPAA
jgi:hypothetical protein